MHRLAVLASIVAILLLVPAAQAANPTFSKPGTFWRAVYSENGLRATYERRSAADWRWLSNAVDGDAAGSGNVTVANPFEGKLEQAFQASQDPTCPQGQYKARYWANQTLSGVQAFARCEERVDNDWGGGGPGGGVPTDGFSARYVGQINFDAADYRFTAGSDDGLRLYVDGQLVIDEWDLRSYAENIVTRTMTAGVHDIRLDYFENNGDARVRLDVAKQAPAVAACSDGQDNDGDGQTDWPNDPGCASGVDDTEAPDPPAVTQCSDMLDNDGDGKIDNQDPGCADAADNDETDPPSGGAVDLTQPDGGANYWAQFTNGWSDPGRFIVSAFLRPANDQSQVDRYKDFGLTTLDGVENPEGAQEGLLRQAGLKTIMVADERTRFNDLGSETFGWLGGDELDMTQGGEFKCENGTFQASLQAQGIGVGGIGGDGRLVQNNFGKGVGIWSQLGFGGWTEARASCYVNHPYNDLVTLDQYWLTDQGFSDLPGFRHGFAYGDDIDRLRHLDGLDGTRQPHFITVELGPPGSGETFAPAPAEVRSAAWHSIIAGARGVTYFDHNFGTDGGTHCGSTILSGCYPGIYQMAKGTNHQIAQLAPVLNAPTVSSGHSLSGAQTRRMVKWSAGKFYVFLASYNGGDATFQMPCVGDATATRLAPANLPGEAATVPVGGGSFTDGFADKNAVHVYRIDGGSSCGL